MLSFSFNILLIQVTRPYAAVVQGAIFGVVCIYFDTVLISGLAHYT